MAVTAAEIRAILSVQDQLSQTLAKVQGELRNLGGAATSSGNAARAAGPSWVSMSTAVAAGTVAANAFMAAARGVAGVLASANAASVDFGDSMAAARSKLSTEEWDQYGAALQKNALRLGKDFPLSAAEAGRAQDLLIAKGLTAKQVLDGGADSVVRLSSATGSDLMTSTKITAAAMDTFNVRAEDMTRVTNLITGSIIKGGMSVTDYGYAMQAAGAVIKLAGGNIEDANLAIAVMAKMGIEGSDAGTSLKTMYGNLQPTTKAATNAMLELGLVTKDGRNAFYDATGKVKSYDEISRILAKSLEGLTEQQQQQALETMFGSDAIRAGAAAAEYGRGKYGALKEAIGSVDADEVARKRMDSLAGSLKQFGGSAETLGIVLLGKLTPGMKTVIDTGTELLNMVLTKLDTPEAAAFFDGLGATATKAGDNLYAAGGAVSDFGTTVQTWLGGTAGATVKAFSDTAGSVLIGLAAILRGDAKGAAEAFGQAFADLGASLGGLKESVIDPVATAIGGIKDTLGEAATIAAGRGVWDDLSASWGILKDAVGDAAQNMDRTREALQQLGIVGGQQSDWPKVLGLAFKVMSLDLKLVALEIGGVVDGLTTMIAVTGNSVAANAAAGRALRALATGDLAGASAAWEDWKAAAGRAKDAASDWATNSVARLREGANTMQQIAETNGDAIAAAAGTGMSKATLQIGNGAAEMQRLMEANAGPMGAAAEAGGAAVVAATQTTMAQTVDTITAAGPAMAAAASEATGSAVAAVEAQAGPASAAGSAVGDSMGAGMDRGLSGWVGSIMATARNMVNSVFGAANAEAESHSPSKRAERDAENWGRGYVKGVENLAPEVAAAVRDMIDAAMAYTPVGKEIARVEREIKDIRDKSQTDALFRAKEMITIDSEALRLKQDLVTKERDLLPIRQGLAAASRAIADAERGSLQFRQDNIQFGKLTAEQNIKVNNLEREKVPLQARQLELERQLISAKSGSKEEKRLNDELDKLRKQQSLIDNTISQIRLSSRLTELDLNTQKERNTIAATGAKLEAEGLGDRVRGQEAVIQSIRDQIDVLGAERAVFDANEALIRNATENEIAYRERLIRVFQAEGAPLMARIEAGLLLIDQLEKEGAISKELADSLRDVARESGVSATNVGALGKAADVAAPQLDAAAKKAAEMAEQARAVALANGDAKTSYLELGATIGKIPSLAKVAPIFKPDGRSFGGQVSAGVPYIVGDGGRPEVFVPGESGTILSSQAQASMLGGYGAAGRGFEGGAGGNGGVTVIVQSGAVQTGTIVHERDLPDLVKDMFLKGLR